VKKRGGIKREKTVGKRRRGNMKEMGGVREDRDRVRMKGRGWGREEGRGEVRKEKGRQEREKKIR